MTFSKIWGTTGLVTNERVKSTELNQLDADHANAVDGYNGGTYQGAITLTGPLAFSGSGSAEFMTGTILDFDSGSEVDGYITIGSTTGINFKSSLTSALINIIASSSAASGANLTLQAQNTTASSGNGGNVILQSGTGGAGGISGAVQLLGGAVLLQQFNPWSGNVGPTNQARSYQVYPCVVTAATTSPVDIFSFVAPAASHSCMLKIEYAATQPANASFQSSGIQMFSVSNNAGTLSAGFTTNSLPAGDTATATPACSLAFSGSNVIVQVNAISSNATNWSLVISVLYN